MTISVESKSVVVDKKDDLQEELAERHLPRVSFSKRAEYQCLGVEWDTVAVLEKSVVAR